MKLNRLLLMAFVGSAFASPALAQEADIVVTGTTLRMGYEKVSAEVPFGDLNLKNESGVETLRSRVKVEARKMCGVRDGTLAASTAWKSCYDSVIGSAEPQIDRVVKAARAG